MNDDPSESPAQTPSDPTPATGPTPAGNPNLIVGLILGAAALLLFLLILQMTGSGFGESPEIAELREELEARKKAIASSHSPVSPAGDTPGDLATRLSADSAALASLATQLQTMLRTAQANLKTSQDTVRNLSNQLAAISNSATENATLRQQLSATLARAATAESQLRSLQEQATGSPSAAQMESAVQERDALRAQLAQLKASSGEMEPRAVATGLRQQLEEAKGKITELQSKNGKIQEELEQMRARIEQPGN